MVKKSYKDTFNDCQSSIDTIDKNIKNIESQISQLIENDTQLNHLFGLITSVMRISKVTANTMVKSNISHQENLFSIGDGKDFKYIYKEVQEWINVFGKRYLSHYNNKTLQNYEIEEP